MAHCARTMALTTNTSSAIAGTAFIEGNYEIASANGAVTIPSNRGHHIVLLTKAGVAAMTLAAPDNPDDNGARITFIATTANAHTVTATTIGFNEGNTTSDVATFGGAIGDGFECVAYNGEWYTTHVTNVTFA